VPQSYDIQLFNLMDSKEISIEPAYERFIHYHREPSGWPPEGYQKMGKKRIRNLLKNLVMVAGTGFEPVTFGLLVWSKPCINIYINP